MKIHWPEIPLALVSRESRFAEMFELDLPVNEGDMLRIHLEVYPSGRVDVAILGQDWAKSWDSPFTERGPNVYRFTGLKAHPRVDNFVGRSAVIGEGDFSRPGEPPRVLVKSDRAEAQALLGRGVPGKHFVLSLAKGSDIELSGVECFDDIEQEFPSDWLASWRPSHIKVLPDGARKHYLETMVKVEPKRSSPHNDNIVILERHLRGGS